MIPTTSPTNGIARDSRGVSEVIGAVLIFALVLLLLAVVQVTAIPVANQQAEYEHNQRVQGDFQDLSGAVDRAATLGTPGTSSVEAGFRYDTRFPFLNPPSPSGSIDTEPGTFVITNANATNGETRDYLNGDAETYDTNALVYRPRYNEYRNAPVTRYEGWTLYNDYDGTARVVNSDGLVADRRISLTALDGGRSGGAPGSITIETDPISGPARTVSVRGTGPDAPVTLNLTTGLSADDWNDILADEDATATQIDDERVKIVLPYADDEGNPIVYDLRLAKVGVGAGTSDEPPHYLTTSDRLPLITAAGGTINVELRDRYNAPVPGETVTFTVADATLRSPDGEVGSTVTVTTDEEGRAAVAVVGPTAATIDVTATAEVADGVRQTERGTVAFEGLAVDTGGGGSGGEFNPDDSGSVKFVSSDIVGSGPQENQEPFYVDVTFENQAQSPKTISQVRMNAYMSNTISQGSGKLIPTNYEVNGSSTLDVGGAYTTLSGGSFDPNLDDGVETTYRFEFFESDGGAFKPDRADVIVYSVQYTDGTSDRYIIQVDDE